MKITIQETEAIPEFRYKVEAKISPRPKGHSFDKLAAEIIETKLVTVPHQIYHTDPLTIGFYSHTADFQTLRQEAEKIEKAVADKMEEFFQFEKFAEISEKLRK